jgi:hypothetical protein
MPSPVQAPDSNSGFHTHAGSTGVQISLERAADGSWLGLPSSQQPYAQVSSPRASQTAFPNSYPSHDEHDYTPRSQHQPRTQPTDRVGNHTQPARFKTNYQQPSSQPTQQSRPGGVRFKDPLLGEFRTTSLPNFLFSIGDVDNSDDNDWCYYKDIMSSIKMPVQLFSWGTLCCELEHCCQFPIKVDGS